MNSKFNKNTIKSIIPRSIYDVARHIFYNINPKTRHIDEQTKKFIMHNKKVWKAYSKNESETEVLFELTTMEPNIISYTYLANILANKHNAKIMAYSMPYSFGKNNLIPPKMRKLYNSFNAIVFSYSLKQGQVKELEELFSDIYPRLKNKKDVFNLTISNLWFGDLLYDFHLKEYKVPTVEINDTRFKNSLKKALFQYIYWRDYFNEHNVAAINVTHCCYLTGIPLRVAIHNNVPAYQCNIHGCYNMTKDRLWAYTDFYDYPTTFDKLDNDEKIYGIKIAKERIDKRFAGVIGVDMHYSTKSAYTDKKVDKVLSNSNKIKILIAVHCFFDSPNGLGKNLFIDFYEWLTFLGNISEKSDYEWYIKTHPDAIPQNFPILEEFIRKYPKFTMIPKETSHHQIIEEGIDFALSVYGTIGFEYASLGKTVISASLSNPHIGYNFNIHPKNIMKYEEILMNLAVINLEIKKDDVYEYYYMKNIKNDMQDWLIDDYHDFTKNIGSYKNQFFSVVYEKFLDIYSQKKHLEKIKLLENFIDSKEYCMQKKHY